MREEKLKRGHKREDGFLFWSYHPGCKNQERWISPKTFERYRIENARRARQWVKANPEKSRLRGKEDRARNREKILARHRAWKAKNKEWVKEYRRKRVAIKRATDPVFRLAVDFRCSIGLAFRNRGFRKRSKCLKILGCSFEKLKEHLEKQFFPGMTWDNRSEWHIDHIVPLASAKTEEDVTRLNHHTNLRPLWAIDNLKKGART
jgi:hypothetical protein